MEDSQYCPDEQDDLPTLEGLQVRLLESQTAMMKDMLYAERRKYIRARQDVRELAQENNRILDRLDEMERASYGLSNRPTLEALTDLLGEIAGQGWNRPDVFARWARRALPHINCVAAIKVIRAAWGMSLKDAKDVWDDSRPDTPEAQEAQP